MKTTKIIFSLLISLLLATQVWAWVRVLGSFHVSDSLNAVFVSQLFLSVFVLKIGLECFVVTIIPVGIMYCLARREMSGSSVLFTYLYLSLALTIVYLFYYIVISGVNYYYLTQHGPVFIVAGIVAALTFYGVSLLFARYEIDEGNEETVNLKRRRYLVSGAATVVGSIGLVGSLIGPYQVLDHSDKYTDINLSKIREGQLITVVIEGRPVWILKRSALMIEQLFEETSVLYDPDSANSIQPAKMRNSYRSIKPEYFVAYGICTHLGCSPTFRPDGVQNFDSINIANKPVFFCTCHGGIFDMAGRVFEGTPPQTNLKVPDYEFIADDAVRIYYPSLIDVWKNQE